MSRRVWIGIILFSGLLFSCAPAQQTTGPVGPQPVSSGLPVLTPQPVFQPVGLPGPGFYPDENYPEPPYAYPSLPGSPVLYWNQVLLDTVRLAKAPPTITARAAAVVSIAVFEALNQLAGPVPPFLDYPGFLRLPPPPLALSQADVVAGAAVTALTALFPALTPFIRGAERAFPFRNEVSTESFQFGAASARQILAMRQVLPGGVDGDIREAEAVFRRNGAVVIPPQLPWRPTPELFLPALQPYWGFLRPFALQPLPPPRSLYWQPPPPPRNDPLFNSDVYLTRDFGEIRSRIRTQDQTLTALFWDDISGETSTPVGHWNLIAQRVVLQYGSPSLLETARVFAMLNIAQADATIGAWALKYGYFFVRPVTLLNTMGVPGWRPLLNTPNFPEYPSGHSTISGAAATVLTALFGPVPFEVGSEGKFVRGYVRHFENFQLAADDAGVSRIFGGIHYMFSNRVGLDSGRKIGTFVIGNYFLPAGRPFVR